MSPLEVFSAILAGVLTTGGTALWLVSRHAHPEYARREEVDGLRALMQVQHAALLRELSQIRDSLDSGRRGR